MNPEDKLKFYLKEESIDRSKLAEQMGYSYESLNSYLHRGITSEFFKRLVRALPDADWNWILKPDSSKENINNYTMSSQELIESIRDKLNILEQNCSKAK